MDNIVTKLQFPPEFFKREERCGHVVGELIKRVWAAELEMLAHVDEICKRHGLMYYAYGGTLLGAIRHNGFIPWDDDLDIAMKREDYNKFLEVAPKELPSGYQILNNYYEEWDNTITKIANSRKIDFGDEYMARFHNCPFAVGIDIFPLDYVSRNAREAEEQKNILTYIGNLTTVVLGRKEEAAAGAGKDLLDEYDRVIAQSLVELQHMCGVRFGKEKTILQQIYILYDQVAGLFREEESDALTNAPKYVKRDYLLGKELFQEVLWLKFENALMPVANGYDAILNKSYKNYMIPRKKLASHGDLYIREQLQVLASIMSRNSQKVITAKQEEDFISEVSCKMKKHSARKVLLVNNSLLEMLIYDAVAIKKIRYVLQLLEKSKDLLVWWRIDKVNCEYIPELQKIVPQFVEEYLLLLKEYSEKEQIVIDEGISINRVIEVCDAYYGDDPSVAKEFQHINKPAMIMKYSDFED